MLDKNKFTELLSGMCEIYDKSPSEFIFKIYYEMFDGYDYPEVERAFKKCLQHRIYSTFPKPAEILEFLEGTKDDKAWIAWIQVRDSMCEVGYYQTPEFNDPIISNCIDVMGGWMEICSTKVDEMPFVEKRFMELYRLFLKREVKEPVKLAGYIKMTNSLNGFSDYTPPAIKIGFPKNKPKELKGNKG